MESDNNNDLPAELRQELIRCMTNRRSRVCRTFAIFNEIKTPTDRSVMYRGAREPVRRRSAQLSSLSYGSLLPKK